MPPPLSPPLPPPLPYADFTGIGLMSEKMKVAKVVSEASEEIVLTNHGQDRYRTIRADPLHRSLKGTLLTYKVTSLTAVTAGRQTNILLQSRESQSMSGQSSNTAAIYAHLLKTPSALKSQFPLHQAIMIQLF